MVLKVYCCIDLSHQNTQAYLMSSMGDDDINLMLSYKNIKETHFI